MGKIPAHKMLLGEAGELYITRQLRLRGFSVEWIGGTSDYDLRIEETVLGEVKSSTLSRRGGGRQGRWQFSLRRHGLPITEGLLFLIFYPSEVYQDFEIDPTCVFIIPGDEIDPMLKKIDITSEVPAEYSGRWAPFKEDWGQVRRIISQAEPGRQVKLFREQDEIPF